MTVRRRNDGHRFVRWLWTSRRFDARVVRAIFVPSAILYRIVMRIRAMVYRRGWLQQHALPLPAVAIGNLTVGGSGKTPLAGWIASRYADHGLRPGILLRGVGGDEALVHEEAVPRAVIVADPDRRAGAIEAASLGADVLVLDDAFQRLDVERDLNICVMSAETSRAVRWSLPAGPWREGWDALDRADAVIVTRKRADLATAERLAARVASKVPGPVAIARLEIRGLVGLVSGREWPFTMLDGRRVVVASAIADPAAFVAQIKRAGAQVQVATWKDHHIYQDADVAWLAHAAIRADHVVITAKDAVKLRDRWPAHVPEPLVAVLSVTFESGEAAIVEALDALVAPISASFSLP
ncbi:MAG TPA: tetraacyldisaccharide 4'-kinase [Gemmatimonadales bacterium]|nr:tetraacyldisaccharide 4'-kinase [Gemmatimonadales bacterium]